MGRRSTGSYTTNEAVRIELSFLLKKGYIQKGKHITGSLSWTNGSAISFESKYTEQEQYLRLWYTLTNTREGKSYKLDYRINLHTKPSNLGKGEVLYFVCPKTGNLCRILYSAYSAHKWMSRQAYTYPIYYPIQTSSKISKYNDRYWEVDRALKKMYEQRATSTYNGRPTKRAQRMERLEETRYRMDLIRWSPLVMPKSLLKAMGRAR